MGTGTGVSTTAAMWVAAARPGNLRGPALARHHKGRAKGLATKLPSHDGAARAGENGHLHGRTRVRAPSYVGPIRAVEFFSRSWQGRAKVTDPLGRTIRSFGLQFVGAWSERDSGFLVEETLTYDQGGALTRSWHIAMDGEGLLLGLEPSQGGRLMAKDTRRGFDLSYDRLRILPGPNVANLRLGFSRDTEGLVQAVGWTKAFGLLPLLRSKATLQPTL